MPQDLHFSSIASIRESDLPKVRNIMMKAAEEIGQVVKSSKSEDTLFCYCIDLFRP